MVLAKVCRCRHGPASARSRHAIRHAAAWLLGWKADGTWQWPTSVSGTELDAGGPRLTGRQDAWCYGTPGISAALALAGQALDDEALTQAAHEALASLANRPATAWDSDGPTLCHGHAGVLQCASGRHPAVAASAAAFVTTALDATRPFAIAHTDGDFAEDRPGFLTGAAPAVMKKARAHLGEHPVRRRAGRAYAQPRGGRHRDRNRPEELDGQPTA